MSQHPTQTYECDNCGHRARTNAPPGHCSVCGGEMINISVARNS
ncbi:MULTISPECIES: rubrerythrin-like domain-containing protein [Haloprofundus]|nr:MULTISPECIES: rubrerythrin-like domain-containing protein [Haloprofundus]QCJ46907.1 rubrerythrin-like domain-containing protein [Haloprofundus sp. MHR1]